MTSPSLIPVEISFGSGERSLSVRQLSITEGFAGAFLVSLQAVSRDARLDLDALVGTAVSVHTTFDGASERERPRCWSGVCSHLELIAAEATGVSTYHMRVVPHLWLLTQRTNHRIFQHLSIPEIVAELLAEWRIAATWRIDRARYPKLDYRAQYAESDFAFFSRLLEEAGITFYFDTTGDASTLRFDDAPQLARPSEARTIRFLDRPMDGGDHVEYVTAVRLAHDVRPGAHVIRDYDFRNPGFPLFGTAPASSPEHARLEQYHYRAGAFVIERPEGHGTPAADDKAFVRHDAAFGAQHAEQSLVAERAGHRSVTFETSSPSVAPGVIFALRDHPHPELAEDRPILVTETSWSWSHGGELAMSGRAVFADEPWRPARKTPKPVIAGVQSATVVGPAGEEIHTDEFGRVRVQFPWDRRGTHDDGSSCWIRVSQGWAGTGYGVIVIPRIGQEVLVGFLDGDPDHPVIVGRVFNAVQAVPYALPEHKTRSTWKSDSSLGSGGFNEIMFEDLKDKELVYVQAQKNLRKLVKNDETITVGNDRQKLVLRDELETTGGDRTEVTRGSRTEITFGDRETIIWGNRSKRIVGDEIEHTLGNRTTRIGGDHDVVIEQTKRERVDGDAHLVVRGERRERVDDNRSLSVGGDRQERVGGHHGLEARTIHLRAGTSIVIEAASDITFKGPGGFVRIDAGGVTVRGTLVRINSGGEAGDGAGSHPVAPAAATLANIEPSEPPATGNVAETGFAQ